MPALPFRRFPLLALLLTALVASGCSTASRRADRTARAPAAKATAAATARSLIATGDAAVRRGDHAAAVVEYVKALSAEPDNPDLHLRVAASHAALGNYPTASQAYRKALALRPTSAIAREGIGLLLVRDRRLDEAKGLLDKAVAGNAALWRARNGLGVIADLKGQHAVAVGHYQKALALRPDEPELLNNLGYSRYLAGQLDAGQVLFERAVAVAPGYEKAWSNLGLVLARRKQYDAAVSAFGRLMEPPQAHYSAGYVSMLDGNYGDAVALFREAIALSPSYYEAAHASLAQAERQTLTR